MNIKEYCRKAMVLNEKIANQQLEIEHLKAIATSTASNGEGERVQTSGAKSKIEAVVIKTIELSQKLDAMIDEYCDVRQELNSNFEKLNKAECNIMKQRYLHFKDFGEIADAECLSYKTIINVHGKALKNLEKVVLKNEN